MKLSKENIIELISEIADPEIPVISIAELGILRSVEIVGDSVIVKITPTYSGCPAMNVITDDIKNQLKKEGIENVIVKTVYAPAWTTDWINDDAKEKLRLYGISPPGKLNSLNHISGTREVACPRCQSHDVKLVSLFGSTACKALYKCNVCMEPFDQFKCH